MTNEKTHYRPKFSLEFKEDAVKLVVEKGYTQHAAAVHPAYRRAHSVAGSRPNAKL